MLSLILVGTGCIIFPVPSVTPAYASGVFDEAKLDSLIGLEQDEVTRQIGWPDFFGFRGHSYVMVYQGEKHYSTDVYLVAGAQNAVAGWKIDDGTAIVFYCQVLELDENRLVQGHDVIARPTGGMTKREDSDNTVKPVADCSELAWKPDERHEVLTKIAFLEVQAEAGDRAAALAIASEFDDLTYLKVLAQGGDREATLLLASEYHDATGLKVLAEHGDIEAAKELVRLTGESTEALQELAESGDLAAATLLARHANELGPLRSLAESGNDEAVYTLAEEFEDDINIEKLAEKGNYIAAYARYQHLRSRGETALTAWRWLCSAANAGYSKAQAEVGHWHTSTSWDTWRGRNEEGLKLLQRVGAQSDNRIAYMWYTLAVSTGGASIQHAREYYFVGLLTDAEISQAEQMAKDWKPGDCPSAEHRLGPPGER